MHHEYHCLLGNKSADDGVDLKLGADAGWLWLIRAVVGVSSNSFPALVFEGDPGVGSLGRAFKGRGLSINLPFSSQDMLKSLRTDLTLSMIFLEANILWRIPYNMRKTNDKKVVVKKRWLYKEVVKGTWNVTGSETHWKAPYAANKEIIEKIHLHITAFGFILVTTSVSLLSNALRSV